MNYGLKKSVGSLAILLSIFYTTVILAEEPEILTEQDAEQEMSKKDEMVQGEAILEGITVTGRAQKLYRTPISNTGKLPSSPLSSSQIITTINEDLIRDQGARDAQDLYRNISGVSKFSYAGVTARGFRQEGIFYDGLRGDPYVGFNVPQLFNIERVDFLKGPAGMLYGAGAPGGIFNYVTKKPTDEFSARVTGIGGTRSRHGASAEVNGALPIEGMAGRIGVFYEDRDTMRKHSGDEVTIYDAGITSDFKFATLTLQATRYEQNKQGNRLRGVPVDDNGNFLTDTSWNHNEASDFLNMEANVFQAQLEGEIGESVIWNAVARYTENEQVQNYHEPRNNIDTNGDGVFDLVPRQFRDQFREEEQVSFGTNLIWSKDFNGFENRLMVGYDYFDSKNSFLGGHFNSNSDMIDRFLAGTSLPGDILPLSLTNPQYGRTQPSNYNITFRALRVTEQTRQGAYLIDEVTIGKFTGVAGVRFDDFKDSSGNKSFSDNNTSYRVGLIYKIRDDISFFGQWADSYEPQGISRQNKMAGGPFEPTVGTILEGGVKMELYDGGVQLSATVYEIVKENILQPDPAGDPEGDGVNNFIPFGEVTSKGFELDIATDLTPNWALTASYGYNDTKITKNNGNTIRGSIGDRFANAPMHQLGFWTRYQVPSINTAFAFGGDHLAERVSFSGQTVKPYTIFDASIIWQPGPFSVLLKVNNLFDKEYAASGFSTRTGHFPGESRSAFIEISREWY